MIYSIIYTESYNAKAEKFFKKRSNVIKLYSKVLKLLELNPSHPCLRLHRLSGNLADLYSISIDMQYRILFKMMPDKQILLITFGDHDEIYGKNPQK